ncbi:MAG TPA: hypothetical protein VIJ58_00725 [Candidatus Dormibacteraeota bacterium]
MKRCCGHSARDGLAEQIGEAEPELAGGADAESDREDLPRLGAPAREQVRGAVGQRAGLAGARPGEQQQRTGAMGYCLGLLRGQSREQAFGPGRRVIAQARVGLGQTCLLQ